MPSNATSAAGRNWVVSAATILTALCCGVFSATIARAQEKDRQRGPETYEAHARAWWSARAERRATKRLRRRLKHPIDESASHACQVGIATIVSFGLVPPCKGTARAKEYSDVVGAAQSRLARHLTTISRRWPVDMALHPVSMSTPREGPVEIEFAESLGSVAVVGLRHWALIGDEGAVDLQVAAPELSIQSVEPHSWRTRDARRTVRVWARATLGSRARVGLVEPLYWLEGDQSTASAIPMWVVTFEEVETGDIVQCAIFESDGAPKPFNWSVE